MLPLDVVSSVEYPYTIKDWGFPVDIEPQRIRRGFLFFYGKRFNPSPSLWPFWRCSSWSSLAIFLGFILLSRAVLEEDFSVSAWVSSKQ